MWNLTPINIKQWIDEHRELLKPPVGNKRIYTKTGFVVQVVGGPNSRKDFHDDPGEEFFYQLEGDMLLKTMQDGRPKDIPIRQGEILLIPPHLPHSPQRFANTVGLVIERPRLPKEQDGLMWFCENCHATWRTSRPSSRRCSTVISGIWSTGPARSAARSWKPRQRRRLKNAGAFRNDGFCFLARRGRPRGRSVLAGT